MRTSQLQYEMMVAFMEVHGDLSKPSGGPRGRHFIQLKWKELTNQLNNDVTGDPRPEDKWRKVWSDYKNNVKKKYAKINRAAGGTGGGPALQLSMTDLENRVMQIIGVQAARGMSIEEAGIQSIDTVEAAQSEAAAVTPGTLVEIDLNTPSTSYQPTVSQSPLPSTDNQPPPPTTDNYPPPPSTDNQPPPRI